MSDEALISRIVRLRRAISAHKKAIKEAREALARDAGELADLEARCRALGIHLVYVPRQGTPQA